VLEWTEINCRPQLPSQFEMGGAPHVVCKALTLVNFLPYRMLVLKKEESGLTISEGSCQEQTQCHNKSFELM